MRKTVALFGESEKGDFQTAYYCETLSQLEECLGHPPEDSRGLHYAVQALMYEMGLIFFRVKEEGFSTKDYLSGLSFLENKALVPELAAVCLPGVGDHKVIEASSPICQLHKSILVISEADLYDYLTAYQSQGPGIAEDDTLF